MVSTLCSTYCMYLMLRYVPTTFDSYKASPTFLQPCSELRRVFQDHDGIMQSASDKTGLDSGGVSTSPLI